MFAHFLPVSAEGLAWLSDWHSLWRGKLMPWPMLWKKIYRISEAFFFFFYFSCSVLRDCLRGDGFVVRLILFRRGQRVGVLCGIPELFIQAPTHTSSLFQLLKSRNYLCFTRLWKCQSRTGVEILPMVLLALSCLRNSLYSHYSHSF